MTTVLEADLEVVSLASVLQVAESEQLSGAFNVVPEGSLVMHRGNVVAAVFGRLSGLDAALTLLMIRSTRTVFDTFPVDPSPPLADMMALIIDGARLNDDWGNLASRVLGPRPDLDLSTCNPTVRSVLQQMDGDRIVDEALRRADVDVVRVLDDLLDLRDQHQLIELAPPRPQRLVRKTATPTPAPRATRGASLTDADGQEMGFYDLMDTSRSAIRARDYVRAERLLRVAQELRPDDRAVAQNLRRITELIESKT